MMSNYVLHLPEHTWNDLALTERELPSRRSYRTNTSPAKRKSLKATKVTNYETTKQQRTA